MLNLLLQGIELVVKLMLVLILYTLLGCSNRDSAMFDDVIDSKEDLKKSSTDL